MSPFGSRAWINNRNIERGIGEIEMNADPKHKGGHDDADRARRAWRHQEEVLDDALKNTFPASDPVSIVISEEKRMRPEFASGTHRPGSRGARSRHHIGSHIERLKAKAAQSARDGKLEDEVARLKRANQELRTKNRTLTKWAEDEIAKVKVSAPSVIA